MIHHTTGNNKDITQRTIAAQRGDRWQAGFTAYCDGKGCPADADARQGWLAASKAHAEASTPGYAESRGW